MQLEDDFFGMLENLIEVHRERKNQFYKGRQQSQAAGVKRHSCPEPREAYISWMDPPEEEPSHESEEEDPDEDLEEILSPRQYSRQWEHRSLSSHLENPRPETPPFFLLEAPGVTPSVISEDVPGAETPLAHSETPEEFSEYETQNPEADLATREACHMRTPISVLTPGPEIQMWEDTQKLFHEYMETGQKELLKSESSAYFRHEALPPEMSTPKKPEIPLLDFSVLETCQEWYQTTERSAMKKSTMVSNPKTTEIEEAKPRAQRQREVQGLRRTSSRKRKPSLGLRVPLQCRPPWNASYNTKSISQRWSYTPVIQHRRRSTSSATLTK